MYLNDFNTPALPAPETVRVTAAAHPLKIARTFEFVEVGKSIREVVQQLCPVEFQSSVLVFINGIFYDRDTWDSVLVAKDDIVVLRAVPQGNGGKIFKSIFMLAIIAISLWQPEFLFADGALFGAGGAIGGGVAAFGAIGAVANLALNALIPPATIANANSNSGALPQYTFGVGGIQNDERPYQTMPVMYGRTLFTPPKGAHSYTVISNNYQYLYCLFDLGPGPIKISDIRIGTTPIDDFADLQYEVREGRSTDTPVTLYNNAVHQWPLSIGLINVGDNGEYQTPAGVSNIAIDIQAPGGLFTTNGTGQLQQEYAYFDLTITDVTTGDVAFETTIDLLGASSASVGNTYVVGVAEGSIGDALPVGQYNVKVTRTSEPPDQNKGTSVCYWTNVRSWGPSTGPLLPVGNAQIAMVVRATEQLNGDITALNCIAERYVQTTTDGVTWTEELNTHPAWASYHALTSTGGNARALDPTRVDVASLIAWAETYPEAEFNYVFTSRTTVWQALRTIGSAGRAVPTVRDGLYGFVFDYVQDSPVQMFTSRNVQGFQATKTYLDEIDGMEIRYIAETQGWQQHSIYAYAEGITAETADFDYVSTLDLVGVTTDDWAMKLGSYFFAASILRNTTYSFTTDLDHLACNPGDRVLIQHDAIGKGLGSGRITAITRDGSGNVSGLTIDNYVTPDQTSIIINIRTSNSGIYQPTATATVGDAIDSFTLDTALADNADFVQVGDLVSLSSTTTVLVDAIVKTITPSADFKATVTCLDYAPSVHNGDAVTTPPLVNDRVKQFEAALPTSSVTILSLTAGENDALIATGGSAVPQIHCSFVTNMDGVAPSQYDAQWQLSTDIGWKAPPTLPPGSTDFYIPISITNVGTSYSVRVRGSTPLDTNPGPWAQAELTITEYLQAPPAPTSLTVTAEITSADCVIKPADGLAPAKYRIYENSVSDFGTATVAQESTGPNITVSGLSAKLLYYFWATTVNAYGVESAPVGPVSALPLPVGIDDLGADVSDFVTFLADAARNAQDQISDLSQAITSVGLGARVDFVKLTNNYIAADSTLFTNLTNGYMNAISQAVGADSSIVTDITSLQATLSGYSGTNTVADAVSALQTSLSDTNNSLSTYSAALTGVQSVLNGFSGAGAVNSAIAGLQSQITDNNTLTGDSITSINQSITTLQNTLTGYDGTHTVASAVETLSTQTTDNANSLSSQGSAITTLTNALSGYTGSGAIATAITGINNSITSINGTLTSTSNLANSVSAQVGNMYASGQFRVSTSSAPSGADARIALEVAASSGGSPYGAAIYLDAMSGGTSRVTIVADQFYLTDGSSNTSPFFFTGGDLFLNNAYVQNLTANNLAVGAVTTGVMANNSATDNVVDSVGIISLSTNTYTTLCSETVSQTVANSPVFFAFSGELQCTSGTTEAGTDEGGPAFTVYLYRDGSLIGTADVNLATHLTGSPPIPLFNAFLTPLGRLASGVTGTSTYNFLGVDPTCPSGSHTYSIVVLPTFTVHTTDGNGNITGTYTGSASWQCNDFSLQILSFKK